MDKLELEKYKAEVREEFPPDMKEEDIDEFLHELHDFLETYFFSEYL